MIFFLASILLLTIAFVIFYKFTSIKFCAVCAAVVITWIIGLIGLYSDQPWANPMLVAILLGASLGALAERYGKKFGLIWKTLLVLFGLPAIYFLTERKLMQGIFLLAVIGITTLFSSMRMSKGEKDLFNNCC